MKNLKKVLTIAAVFCFTASTAMAEVTSEAQKIQTYAHPTMFSQNAQEKVTADSTYVVGGKIRKCKNQLGLKNKDNVAIASWAKDVLNLIKTEQKIETFNPKMPILRSEFAVVLAEGFNMADSTISKAYTDIADDYWAKLWIYRALNGGVMIGYPEGDFRPDQPITKAEVFATIATMINVPTDGTNNVPQFKNKDIKFIPKWAVTPTQEVVFSQILDAVPNPDKVNNDEYLSKEQVAYLVSAIRASLTSGSLTLDANAPSGVQKYQPVALKVKLTERISARHSNIGDRFNAKTTEGATVQGIYFPEGSTVVGEVVEVARPGVFTNESNVGYIKVKFLTLKNGDTSIDFPKQLSEAQADVLKNPNIIARLLGAPLTAAARITGVAGRTLSTGVDVCADGLEKYGDQLSNTFVNTFTLHPGAGLKSFGNSFITLGKGVFNLCELAVSGTFGVLYEIGDEFVYLLVPSLSNSSSLNADEELTIIF